METEEKKIDWQLIGTAISIVGTIIGGIVGVLATNQKNEKMKDEITEEIYERLLTKEEEDSAE